MVGLLIPSISYWLTDWLSTSPMQRVLLLTKFVVKSLIRLMMILSLYYILILPGQWDTFQPNRRHVATWWRHQMETFSALLAICAGNSPGPVNSPHKGQWRGALMFSLICVWINDWVNNHEAGDLRRYRAHYDVTVMKSSSVRNANPRYTVRERWRTRFDSWMIQVQNNRSVVSESRGENAALA